LCRCSPSERCWSSVQKARAVAFRRRRFRRARSVARRVHLGRGWRRPGRDVPKGTMRPGRDRGLLGAEGAMRCDTWLLRTCKGGTVRGRGKGAACKGVSAVRRHAGGLYDAGSYYYTLVKCLKPFVRNGKGVIEADDHARGSPINSEPLVMKRTHCNEKRVPKAPTSLSVFCSLSISLVSLLVSYRQQLRQRVESSREKRVSDFSARLLGGLQAAVIRRGEKFSGGCCVSVHLRARFPPTVWHPPRGRIQNRMART
jgi:hypothetical protein